MSYVLVHKETGETLGVAYSVERVGEILLDLFFDHGIMSHEVDVLEFSEEEE